MDSGLATGLMLLGIPASSLAVTYWNWKKSKNPLSYFAFSMYVLDSRRKYLISDPLEQSLYDSPNIKKARIQCLIGIAAFLITFLVIESWPPCRILYNCVVVPSP